MISVTALFFPALGCGQSTETVRVPTQIVSQLSNDPILGPSISVDDDGSSESLVASAVDLNDDGTPELIVHGVGVGCGPQNCPHWVFGLFPEGYRSLLDAGFVDEIEQSGSDTNGYLDVESRFYNSAVDHTFSIYKFDGESYQLAECRREFYLLEDLYDDEGNVRVLGEPRVIPISCAPPD